MHKAPVRILLGCLITLVSSACAAAVTTTNAASSVHPNSDPQVTLSKAPGSYTLPVYEMCGRQFDSAINWTVYIYPDIPAKLKTATGFEVALSSNCDQGGSFDINPVGSARIEDVLSATDGKPLVVAVTPPEASTGRSILTFTPGDGQAKQIEIDWS